MLHYRCLIEHSFSSYIPYFCYFLPYCVLIWSLEGYCLQNVQKTLKFCFFFSSMHERLFVRFFFFFSVTSIPNFVARASPFLCLIRSRPHVIWFPGCTCYWDEWIREVNKNVLLQNMHLYSVCKLFFLFKIFLNIFWF